MRTARAMALAVGLTLAAGSSLAASPLDALRWEIRALLIFAPSPDDGRARDLDAQLSVKACELADRDLVVARAPASGGARLGGQVLARSEATALRRRYGVTDQDFTVVLVGKDGGEKLRAAEPRDLDDVLALIDGMPMRRAEMRERGRVCAG